MKCREIRGLDYKSKSTKGTTETLSTTEGNPHHPISLTRERAIMKMLHLRVYPGVVLKVEKTKPGAPADGKFKKGEIIAGVNAVPLKGRNPYVVLGEVLTKAEATDGKLVFDVLPQEGAEAKKVAVDIPILGSYSPTWPLKYAKSQAIIKNASAYYAKNACLAGRGSEAADRSCKDAAQD